MVRYHSTTFCESKCPWGISIKELKAYFKYTALSAPMFKKEGSIWCKISWLHRRETRMIPTGYPVSLDLADAFSPAAPQVSARCPSPPFPHGQWWESTGHK